VKHLHNLAILIVLLPAAAWQEPLSTVVGVKLIQATRDADVRTFDVVLPPDCAGCVVLSGTPYQGRNRRELFFHARVPANQPILRGVLVRTDTAVACVIVEKQRVPFSAEAGAVRFDLPVAVKARSSTMEVQTHLEWPGIVLRVEHAFPDRRAGKYATGRWPAVERAAALHLEFGLREAIRALGLDREVADKGLGKLHLMGFDTNNPLGHEDYPPHIHLILRWPHFAGSQAPHFYLSEKGRLRGTMVTIDGMPHIAATTVPDGRSLPAVDYLGNTLYETVVTEDGGLMLRRPGGKSCRLEPEGDGFASGARVACDGREAITVRASDDTDRGELRVTVGAVAPEVYRYDVDTAQLIRAPR
jgi:hypothetical protein